MILVTLSESMLNVFDRTTFYQLKDAATAVLARKKSTSLAEIFSVRIKIYCGYLNNWFLNRVKPKFTELDDIKIQIFINENPIISAKTCSVCGFLLDVEVTRESKHWYDFIVEYKYLFLKNISSYSKFKKIDIENIDNYYSFFDRLIKLFTAFESDLDGIEETLEFKDFFEIELDNVYCTVEKLKEDIVVKRNSLVKVDFADKTITFTYSSLIQFEEAIKIEGIPMLKNFMKNIKGIMNN